MPKNQLAKHRSGRTFSIFCAIFTLCSFVPFGLAVNILQFNTPTNQFLESISSMIGINNVPGIINYRSFAKFPFGALTINPLNDSNCKQPHFLVNESISRDTVNAAFVVYKMCDSSRYNKFDGDIIQHQSDMLRRWIDYVNQFYPRVDKILMTPKICCNELRYLANNILNQVNINDANVLRSDNSSQTYFYDEYVQVKCMHKWKNSDIGLADTAPNTATTTSTQDRRRRMLSNNYNRAKSNVHAHHRDSHNVYRRIAKQHHHPSYSYINQQKNINAQQTNINNVNNDENSDNKNNNNNTNASTGTSNMKEDLNSHLPNSQAQGKHSGGHMHGKSSLASVLSKAILKAAKSNSNCCGEYEYGKLDGWLLIEYDYIFMLDWDIKILHPIDELFYCMESNKFDFINTKGGYSPFNGGFLILKPNIDVYNDMRYILKYGVYNDENSWFNSKIEFFHGAETNQGFLFWYFYFHDDLLHNKNKPIKHLYSSINKTRKSSVAHLRANYVDECVYNCQGIDATRKEWSHKACDKTREIKVDHHCRIHLRTQS